MKLSSLKPFIFLAIFGCCLFLSSCLDTEEFSNVKSGNNERVIAFPIVNTEVSIVDYAENASDNTAVRIEPDGKMTVFYEGEVIRKTALELFPPIPGSLVSDGIMDDTVTTLGLTFDADFILKKAIFKENSIRFRFVSSFQEDVTIKLTVPEWSKDGEIFQLDLDIPYTGSSTDSVITENIFLDGWEVTTETNTMTFIYDARLPNGDRVKLDEATYDLNFLFFSYVEAFFTQNTNSESGDIITVGVYNNWVSGGLYFENPKVTFSVENSIGFPVRAYFNEMRLTNVLNETFDMEGQMIDDGVDFPYPSLSEVGELKISEFEFNETNSNVQAIFNEKVKLVRYDIDAVGNPDNDTSIIGFLTDSSYYKVDIAVELPLLGSANNLVLADTFDFDLNKYDQLESIEFKLITQNRFPIDMTIQTLFLDENGLALDSMFVDDPLFLNSAEEISPGILMTEGEKTTIMEFDAIRFEKIKNARQLAFRVLMESEGMDNESLWIYSNYGMDVRMGAKITLNN